MPQQFMTDEEGQSLLEDTDLGEMSAESIDSLGPASKGAIAARSSDSIGPTGQRLYIRYFFIPFVFLTVALLGGLRIGGIDGSFIFLKPALLCLIFASITLVLFARARLIEFDGWFSERSTTLKNVANGAVLLTLFAATTQLFNSLIPEQGLPFWIVAFCFFWTLWNNLFADFDTKKLLRSLGGLFGFAFVAKYLVLANLTAPAGRNWLMAIIENPGQEAITRLLDLPQFSVATGYIQFFAVALFLIGLYLLPQTTHDEIRNEAKIRNRQV